MIIFCVSCRKAETGKEPAMARILITEDGKRVDISSNNISLYVAPKNPPNTGTTYTRGTNLYVHKTRKGNWYYFTEYWSMWQGEEGGCHLVSREEAIDFLREKATVTGWGELSTSEIKEANEHFGEDIFEEDA
jgi:hypothetical protein